MIKRKRRQAVTLIEIMIVILLIGLISGALVFNMRGSMDKGKIFKSNQNAQRVYDALMMANASGEFNLADIEKSAIVKEALSKSPFVKDANAVILDGWGVALKMQLKGTDDIEIYSEKARAWETAHSGSTPSP